MRRLALAALLALSGCTRFVDLTRGQGPGTDGGSNQVIDAWPDGGPLGDAFLADDGGAGPSPDAVSFDAQVHD